MMLVIDHAGFDLKFFNDPAWYNVQSVQQLEELFDKKVRSARGSRRSTYISTKNF